VLFLTARSTTTTLTILHFNDLHSRFDAHDGAGALCTASSTCRAGIARLAARIATERANDANSIVLSAGDMSQGSIYFSLLGEHFLAEMLDHLALDAAVVGNHEFDGGDSDLFGLARELNFPLLAGNVTFSSSSAGALLPRTTTVTRGGETIGIVSAVTASTSDLSSPDSGDVFEDPRASLTAQATALHDAGIDIIIALTHVGYADDLKLAATVPYIDVIVGGHSDTLLSNIQKDAAGAYPATVKGDDGRSVLVVQTVPYGEQLGKLTVTFKGGSVLRYRGEPIVLDAAITPDPGISALLEEARKTIDTQASAVVFHLPVRLEGDPDICRHDQCAMGTMIADAALAAYEKESGARFSFINSGMIRGSLPAGTTTAADLISALPFDDTFVAAEMTGAEIGALLQKSLAVQEERSGGYLQVGGLRVRYDPIRSELCGVTDLSGVPLQMDASYTVLTSAYLAAGKDGYAPLSSPAALSGDLYGILERYLKNNQYVPSATDDRIVPHCS
jgi:5'-nucleotidase